MIKWTGQQSAALCVMTVSLVLSAAHAHGRAPDVEDRIIHTMADKGMDGIGLALLHYGDFWQLANIQAPEPPSAFKPGSCLGANLLNANATYLVSSLEEFTLSKASAICTLDPNCIGFGLHASHWSVMFAETPGTQREVT